MLNFEKLFKFCEKTIRYLKSNTGYLLSVFFPKLVNFDFDLMFLLFPQRWKVKHNSLTKLIFYVLLYYVV